MWILRAAGHDHGHPPRVAAIRLDLDDMPWAGVPCWSGGAQRWTQYTVPIAYALRYDSHVRPAMPGNPISLGTLLRVAQARAQYAEHRTGRDCRPTNATLAACADVSIRTVQRASTALRLLGVATEILRGRQRSWSERMASWRVGDGGRGWASVWALHDSRFPRLSPHPEGSPVREKPSPNEVLTTANRRQGGGRGAKERRHSPDEGGLRLANKWIADQQSPPWARKYRTPAAWAGILAGPAAHGWTPRDVNQLIRDWIGVGHWLPERPHKPIGLLGAIIGWHDNLAERPAALDEAREAAERAQRRERIAAQFAEREQHRRAREAAKADIGGPGHRAARRVLDEIAERTSNAATRAAPRARADEPLPRRPGRRHLVAVVDDLGHSGVASSPANEEFGRQPPQDMVAEQSVLGGMLLSKDAIADVLERLRPGDFYRPAHQNIYDAILDLYGRGEPADAVTVAAELDRHGMLRRIGGALYLHTLISTVPTAANAGYYAGIVAEKALLRRLVEAGTRVVQYGYAGAEGADVAEVVDRAQAEIYDVTEGRTSEDFVPLEQLLQPTMDEIEAIESGGGLARGVPTGFTELDAVTNGLHPGQMVIIAARPGMGKSTLALDFLRSCAIKNRMAGVIFSLEMSKSEIVMRLLSAEAKIKFADMRSGRMRDEDWTRLARRMSEISEAPLYIDDSPNLTMMEVRAKARRLRQKADLKLVVVDYLQLMSSGKKFESRQQEVSEFSRSLKLLAKELEVPVVALSQLNRSPEQRTDKKPMLADLREVGSHRAGLRCRGPDAPARPVRPTGSRTRRRGRSHYRQAPQRSNEDGHRGAPAALLTLRQHGQVAAALCRFSSLTALSQLGLRLY